MFWCSITHKDIQTNTHAGIETHKYEHKRDKVVARTPGLNENTQPTHAPACRTVSPSEEGSLQTTLTETLHWADTCAIQIRVELFKHLHTIAFEWLACIRLDAGKDTGECAMHLQSIRTCQIYCKQHSHLSGKAHNQNSAHNMKKQRTWHTPGQPAVTQAWISLLRVAVFLIGLPSHTAQALRPSMCCLVASRAVPQSASVMNKVI